MLRIALNSSRNSIGSISINSQFQANVFLRKCDTLALIAKSNGFLLSSESPILANCLQQYYFESNHKLQPLLFITLICYTQHRFITIALLEMVKPRIFHEMFWFVLFFRICIRHNMAIIATKSRAWYDFVLTLCCSSIGIFLSKTFEHSWYMNDCA